jgi:uncharacterized protein (TIGR03435 family)
MTMRSRNGVTRLTGSSETTEVLCGYLSHQLQRPVLDQTGLTGRYDFHLVFATESIALLSVPQPTDTRGPDSEPASTLAQAVDSQLGLRMMPQKVPVAFLVIDHIDKTPVEN